MVRACAFEKFFRELSNYVSSNDEPARNGAFLLEYSCWCDGGERYENLEHLHHRHVIAVARDGEHFMKNCWKKVRMRDPPFGNFRYKYCVKMKTWQHLKNVLFYVSSSRDSREGVWKSKSSEGSFECLKSSGRGHFYIFKSVAPTFKLCAALSVEGGLQDMITSLRGQSRVDSFARHCFLRKRGSRMSYAVRIRHVIDNDSDSYRTVVPVGKEWEPTGAVDASSSSAFLVLQKGRRMHFEKSDEDRAEGWVERQARKGNLFLDAVKDYLWFPPRNQQRILNEVVPLIRKMDRLNRKWESDEMEHERRLRDLKEDYESRLRDQKEDYQSRLSDQKADYEGRLRDQKAECRSDQKDSYENLLNVYKTFFDEEQKRYDNLVESLLKHADEKTKIIIEKYHRTGDLNLNFKNP